MSTSIDLEDIARITGIEPVTPVNLTLYEQALTHGSSGKANYQRLEFLGDRVLGLTIATELYNRFPGASEGELAARFSMLVSGETCANVARMIALPEWVKLGTQAVEAGARSSDNIAADVMESLIGALYLDQGLDIARSFILRHWRILIDEQHATPKHPKAELQEWALARKYSPPQYEVLARDGPIHAPRFQIAVSIGKLHRAEAEGSNKQSAEKAAAKQLLEQLNKPPKHPKSALQEWAHAHKHNLPKYEVIAQEDDAHASHVRVAVRIGELHHAEAEGSNKQNAEKAAAKQLLEQLGET